MDLVPVEVTSTGPDREIVMLGGVPRVGEAIYGVLGRAIVRVLAVTWQGKPEARGCVATLIVQ